MNLHLVPDDKYVGRLIDRIDQLGLLPGNKFVVKSAAPFRYIRRDLAGAAVGSAAFDEITGDIDQYDKVFIHFMDEPSVSFVADNHFKMLIWLPWGADIYESLYSPFKPVDHDTDSLTGRTWRNRINFLLFTTWQQISKYRLYKKAYSRIDVIADWVSAEYDFAMRHLPGISCEARILLLRY
jgi:hypothetical protein